jgi:single-stranded-DNA-specific exonuclease
MNQSSAHSLAYHWEIVSQIQPITAPIEDSLREYSPIVRQLLYNRGIHTAEAAEAFLHPSLENTYDPRLMKGIDIAVDRIRYAIQQHEKIAIYGDYDVDGVSGTAILYDFLRRLSADVRPYIPNRFEEGYGVREDGLQTLKNEGIKLVITVDCGARANVEADFAKSIGLDFIITDHHQPNEELPNALCMLNPKQKGETYPYTELTGVGITYKLVKALEMALSLSTPVSTQYLDLVALGTIADIAPLNGENRILVATGLKQLRQTQRLGLKALIGISGLEGQEITAYHVGYMLAPRLNAAGRLESAYAAFELLTTTDSQRAWKLAQELDNQNRRRQELTLQYDLQATKQVQATYDSIPLLVAFDPNFNSGVIGLVAAHLVESFYRPAIVATELNGYIRGSCRSIPEFHITKALDECRDLMEYHGGHAAAAGFTVRKDRFEELIQRMQQIAQRVLGTKTLEPKLRADLPIDLVEVGKLLRENRLITALEQFQPTGYGNPTPSFVTFGVRPKNIKTVGTEKNHLRFDVDPAWKCIAFRKGELAQNMPSSVDMLYHIEKNAYNGNVYLQLNVRDIKPSNPLE